MKQAEKYIKETFCAKCAYETSCQKPCSKAETAKTAFLEGLKHNEELTDTERQMLIFALVCKINTVRIELPTSRKKEIKIKSYQKLLDKIQNLC